MDNEGGSSPGGWCFPPVAVIADPSRPAACNTGELGVCAAGTVTCQSGMLQCSRNVQPSAESCDGLDNDCDGVTDEGNPGGGAACNTGFEGACAAGTMVCGAGSLHCQQTTSAQPEQCGDSIDNDCDGLTDDGCVCAHDSCADGVALADGCDPCVTNICNADPYCCTDAWDVLCVSEVRTVCGSSSCPESWGSCAHGLCESGGSADPLAGGCDALESDCVSQICAVDPQCCSSDWDAGCVAAVASVCQLGCE